ncbi:alpha-L-rhamnosidase [Schumannella soli]|uniref:alpha-L-rhamnosidase n=1 Tax=Schumannella soli TaxID=2590779 RepID=A0A506Y8X4_9MICO|nr:alpha-L-rhamnosidase [Schumannella soli]TPW77627.1 Bacterial alpha-L-rhamnosidase [Schumannella soli]
MLIRPVRAIREIADRLTTRPPTRPSRPARGALVGVAVIALGAGTLLAGPALAASGTSVTGLTVNGRSEPLGIPGAAPSLGWHGESATRGTVQSAYQVQVARSDAALAAPDVWDSGRVDSAAQVDVGYGGPALTAQTAYSWRVRTWDGRGKASGWSTPAHFETGLLSASDWGGAQWIGGPPATELPRWTDTTTDVDFTIDNLVVAVYFRSATLNNGYLWQLSVADGTPQFRPHVKKDGSIQLIESKDISDVISADALRTGTHTLSIRTQGTTITTLLDGTQIDQRDDATFDRGYVGFRTSQATEGTETTTIHRVKVTAADGATLLDTDFHGTGADGGNPFTGGTVVDDGLRIEGNAETIWRSPDGDLPLLRTNFSTRGGETPVRARLYATARGVYQLRLNGADVGDQRLAPGFTDYESRIQHQTYDVTKLVRAGRNALGAELGSGWYAGKVGMWGPGVFGTDPSVLTRLRLDYADGSSQWVDSTDTWTTARGPWTFADNIDGESYDARKEQKNWDRAGFDASGWTAATVHDSATQLVVPQPDEPVRETGAQPTVARTQPTKGTYIYDVGQNMVGVAKMRLKGTAGSTVTIRYGEMLNPDGTLYTANLRAAKVTDHYTFAADGAVEYEPRFTQHGFRYIEITGAASAPTPADVTGIVWGSDLPDTGTLTTSSPMLNQLASNISWGQRGNFLSIPTDTPARDERLGWTGDINVFAPTASYLTDTRAFLGKWLADLRDSQGENGDYPGVSPEPPGVGCCGGGTGWADAGITVPYTLWNSYGDATVVREGWDSMTRFLDHVQASAGEDLIDDGRNVYADWLNLDDPTPAEVLGTAYYAEDARMMSEMAAALGKTAEATAYADLSTRIRAAFAATFVAADGTVRGNSQTAYAMALGMDLVPAAQRAAVGTKFVAKLETSGSHLTTGFLGTPWLLPALTSVGRADLAWKLLVRTDYPSWGYEVKMGATTMWERWNSVMPDGSFGDVGMNSFNHYAYGAVGDWMYRNIGAIAPLEAGYHRIRVAPLPGGGVTHGAGSLQSVYGKIATDWTSSQTDAGARFDLKVTVPVNATAEIVLPASKVAQVTESGGAVKKAAGVQSAKAANGSVTVVVGSGSYVFRVG